jgi:hypothetical protein
MRQPYDFVTTTKGDMQLYYDYVDKLVIRVHQAFTDAQSHLRLAQARYKAAYDQHTAQRTFNGWTWS